MSFMCPRRYFTYDAKEALPLIVFICGGGFEKEDVNVWTPELSYFAKHGYAVACVDYSVLPFSKWPEQIEDVKLAIRYLRAHAKEFWIKPDKIAVMGESAGGYLSALVGTSGEVRDYDKGKYLDQSSAVQAAVPWYPVVNLPKFSEKAASPDARMYKAPDAASFITKNTPPFCIVHGTDDAQVPHSESEYLYDKLTEAGVEADLLLVEGAGHADAGIVNSEVKKTILAFLDKHLK